MAIDMKPSRVLVVNGLLGLCLLGCAQQPSLVPLQNGVAAPESTLAKAIADRANKVEVEGQGTVIKVLPDDHEGDRHQRFIIQLASGQTLLIAHNIDEAPRVSGIREGDTLAFRGEYEWNERGGVIHWTHSDRRGRHPDGWLKHNGRIYE